MHDCCLPHDHGGVFEHGVEKMPGTEAFSLAANVFRQLDDPSRLKIFWLLCHCEECVINLSSLMDMSSPAVSHHLNKLRSSGLIVSRREGKEVYYKAADNVQSAVFHRLIEEMLEISCPQPRQH